MGDINWICENDEVKDVAVVDPTFNSGSNYINVIDHLTSRNYSGKISLQCRLEMMKPEFVNSLNQLRVVGFPVLEFGIQSIHRTEQKEI